jgi:hypothetical protein
MRVPEGVSYLRRKMFVSMVDRLRLNGGNCAPSRTFEKHGRCKKDGRNDGKHDDKNDH